MNKKYPKGVDFFQEEYNHLDIQRVVTEFSSFENIASVVAERTTELSEQMKRKTSKSFGIQITIEKDNRGYKISSASYMEKDKP